MFDYTVLSVDPSFAEGSCTLYIHDFADVADRKRNLRCADLSHFNRYFFYIRRFETGGCCTERINADSQRWEDELALAVRRC